MPEIMFTEFPAFSVDPRVGISRSASQTDYWLLSLPIIGSFHKSFVYHFLKSYMTANSERHSEVFITARKHHLLPKTEVTFIVSCELSQLMGKTKFSSIAKTRTNSVS